MPPSISVPLALATFVIAVLHAFRRVGPTAAIFGGLVYGSLFLPVYERGYVLPLLKAKGPFIAGSLLLVSLALDRGRWRRLRPHRFDLPAAAVSLAPFAASLSNGLGPYDGASAAFSACLYWGAPYLLGRVYLSDLAAARAYAETIVRGALLYVPFCLWEVRMSPQLHRQIYGIDLGRWDQGFRFGGYRPTVFMTHGLMLGMFLAAATLVAFWLWRTRAWRGVRGLSPALCFGVLALTTLLAKSVGAIVLLVLGAGVLEATRRWRRPLFVIVLLSLPTAYCAARVTGWSGDTLIEASTTTVNEARAGSLAYRLANESVLLGKALQRPWFGWGGWGRNLVHDERGRTVTVIDGMWIGQFGSNGLLGLSGMLLVLALPAAALLRRYPARLWGDPRLAAPAALAIVCCLWGVDDLFNAMPDPLFPAACGGVVALAIARSSARRRQHSRAVVTAVTPD